MGKIDYSPDVLKDAKRGTWLTKQGHGIIKQWQERYFLWKDDKLYYFKDNPLSNPNAILAGILELKGCALSRKNAIIGIQPKNKKEVYLITSKDEQEINAWYKDLDAFVNPPPPKVKVEKPPLPWFLEETSERNDAPDEYPPTDYEREPDEELTARLNLTKVCKSRIQELEAENAKLEIEREAIEEARKSIVQKDAKSNNSEWRSELSIKSDNQKYEICICYEESHSSHIVKILTERFQKLEKKMTELKITSELEWPAIQKSLGSSKHIIIVVNQHCLKSPPFCQAIEAVMVNRIPNILVLPVLETRVPEQLDGSSLIRAFFSQKPVLFVEEYIDSVMNQLQESLKTQYHTIQEADVFLSFDPATGQGISKRLWEVLKNKYIIQAPADWTLNSSQIDNLLRRVEKFILVLTEGYLVNKSCLAQMRFALEKNLQIVVVKDYLMKVPENIPVDLKFVLDSCITFKWMAEFNTYCVEKLEKLLGQTSPLSLESDISKIANSQADVVAQNFNAQHPLYLIRDDFKISQLIKGMENFLDCKVNALKLGDNFLADNYVQTMADETLPVKTLICLRSNISTFAIGRMASACINLTRLSIRASLQDEAIVYITDHCPHLADLSVQGADAGDFAFKYLFEHTQKLRRLYIKNCPVSDEACKFFVQSQAQLTHLEFNVCHDVTSKSLVYLASRPRRCLKHVGFLEIKLYEDVMKQFVKACYFLESVDFTRSTGQCVTLENMKFLIQNMPNLKQLTLCGTSIEEKELFEVLLSKPNLICKTGDTKEQKMETSNIDRDDAKKYVKAHLKNHKLKSFLAVTKNIEVPKQIAAPQQAKPQKPQDPTQSQEEKMRIFNEVLQKDYQLIATEAMVSQNMERTQKIATWYSEEYQRLFAAETKFYVYRPFGAELPPQAPTVEAKPAPENDNTVQQETQKVEKPAQVEEPNEQEGINYVLAGNLNAVAKVDFTIFFVGDTGTHSAGFLKSRFDELKQNYSAVEIPRRKAIQPALIEEAVANSHAVVMILSEKSLAVRPFALAMEAADHYRVGVVLVHDADTCFFPAYSEQPASVVHFFSEKAVTFLADYTETVATQILQRVEEFKNLRLHSHNDSSHKEISEEDLHTRMFLSHKRSTAQHIAGRLWESFHKDYKVFLDSEAQFKIHDLERIVQDTELFVLILSAAYFNSQFCVAELSSALKNNKPIVIIQDASFKLPDGFQAAFDLSSAEINKIFTTAPKFVWLPEYHNDLVAKIKSQVLGGSDESVSVINSMKEHDRSFKKALEKKKFDQETPLDLSEWEKFEMLDDFISSLQVAHKCSITNVDLTKSKIDEACYTALLKKLPELQELNLTSVSGRHNYLQIALDNLPNLRKLVLTDTHQDESSLEQIPEKFPLLEEFHISHIRPPALSVIIQQCQNLKRLFVNHNSTNDASMQLIAKFRPNLECLFVNGGDVTDAGLQMITNSCKMLQSLSMIQCSISDLGMRYLVSGQLPLHTLKLLQCGSMSDNTLLAISAACPQLKKLRMSEAQIEGEGLKHLATKCTQLESLNLKQCKIQKEAIGALADFVALKRLNLDDTEATKFAIDPLLMAKYSLTKLSLVEFNNLSDANISSLTSKHNNLLSLAFRGEKLSDQALETISKNCPGLEKVRCISGKFSENALSWFLASLPNLIELDLTYCEITDVFVRRLARCPHPLKHATLSVRNVSQNAMQYLATKKPGLQVKT